MLKMSELFFKNLVGLIIYFFILSIMAIGMIQFLMLYLLSGNLLFWYIYMGFIWLFTVFASKCFSNYKAFADRSYLFFPAPSQNSDLKFESADLEKLWIWSNGATWKELYNSPYECNQIVRKYVRKTLRDSHE